MMMDIMEQPLLSGTKMRLAGDIDPDFLCLVCKMIIANPKMCPTCDSVFCQSCTEGAESCQRCESTATLREPPKFLIKHLLKLEFECEQKELCGMSYQYPEALTHLCPFEEIVCPSEGCSENIQRKDLDGHLNVCPFYHFICTNPGCEKKLSRRDNIEHGKSCRFRIVVCEVCQKQIKIMDFTAHQKKCYFEICPKCNMQISVGKAHDCLKHMGNLINILFQNQQTLIGFIEKDSGIMKSTGECSFCHLLKHTLIYTCPNCATPTCLTCLAKCFGCKKSLCPTCLMRSKFPSITHLLCNRCMEERIDEKFLNLVPVFVDSVENGDEQAAGLQNTLKYMDEYNAGTGYCYYSECVTTPRATATQNLIFKTKDERAMISKIEVKPNSYYDFDKMQVFIGKGRDSYGHRTGSINQQKPVTRVALPDIVEGKFIKIVLTGCTKTGYFGVDEVKVYGVKF